MNYLVIKYSSLRLKASSLDATICTEGNAENNRAKFRASLFKSKLDDYFNNEPRSKTRRFIDEY